MEEPLPSSIFGPEECIEDRTKDGAGGEGAGSVRLIRRWEAGFSEEGRGFSIFRFRRSKNLPILFFSARITKNLTLFYVPGRKNEGSR